MSDNPTLGKKVWSINYLFLRVDSLQSENMTLNKPRVTEKGNCPTVGKLTSSVSKSLEGLFALSMEYKCLYFKFRGEA